MNYSKEPNWDKLKPTIDWDEQEEKLADKLSKLIHTQINNRQMNQQIVKQQKFVRTWNGPSGEIHYFDLVLENGEIGQIGVKDMNSPKIQVGATLHYTVEERTGPTGKKSTNFKMQNPMQFSGPSNSGNSSANSAVNSSSNYRKESPDVQNSISKSVALNNAVLFCKEQKGSKPGDVLDTAEIFLAWLKGESIVETKLAITNEASDDEMPF